MIPIQANANNANVFDAYKPFRKQVRLAARERGLVSRKRGAALYQKAKTTDGEEEEAPPAPSMDIIEEASDSDRASVGDDPSRVISQQVSAGRLQDISK